MRPIVFIIVTLFIVSLSAAQPFGFIEGMTYDELKKIDPEIEHLSDDLYLTKAPTPSPIFNLYAVRIHKTEGLYLVKVVMYIETNVFGTALKSSYKEIVNGIRGKYGEPTANHDFLISGSIWDEPEDYMMSLLKEERYLLTEWNIKDIEAGGLNKILLNATASSTNKGTILVEYHFGDFDKLLKDGKEKTQW